MKLYEIPRGSKILVETDKGMEKAVFHHVDGAYSLCSLGDETNRAEIDWDKTFHLSASTPMKKVGDHYEIE